MKPFIDFKARVSITGKGNFGKNQRWNSKSSRQGIFGVFRGWVSRSHERPWNSNTGGIR